MFTMFFTDQTELYNFEDVKRCDAEAYATFFRKMRTNGVFLAPSAFETGMVSFAHTEEDFAKTLEAVRKSL